MPRPRRTATPATSDRAIVRIRPCRCGCSSTYTECEVRRDGTIEMNSPAARLALSGDLGYGEPLLTSSDVRYEGPGAVQSQLIEKAEAAMAQADREVAQLVHLAEQQGFTVTFDGGSYKWLAPDGEQSTTTPTRVIGRGLDNVRCQLRRIGLVIPRPGQTIEQAIEAQKEEQDMTTAQVIDIQPEPTEPMTVHHALAVLSEFISNRDDSEWQSIAESLEAELAQVRAERDAALDEAARLQQKLDSVRALFIA